MNIDLTGKLAVVTGASGELGRVILRTLASCGADVVIHYHRGADKAAKLLEEVRAMGRRAMMIQADVGDETSVRAMQAKIVSELGDADIIVNNAVISSDWRPVLEQNIADYESQFRSCVLHNVLMAKAFVPGMIKKQWGRVIATNTECAMQCFPTQSAYVAGKRGMDGVLRVLAKEIGKNNITVNQVAPGWMISDRNRGQPSFPDYDKTVALGHRGEDLDIAYAVAFLASDLARFISGVYLPVCGGNVMPTI
jgi:3-oxoacyl-[acyl-carrier protein] reductase